MEPLGTLATALVLSVVVESMVEYFVKDWSPARRVTKYVAAACGVAIAVAFQVDLFGDVLGIQSPWPVAGMVLTGLAVGRGSNYINDLVGRARGGGAAVATGAGEGRDDGGIGVKG